VAQGGEHGSVGLPIFLDPVRAGRTTRAASLSSVVEASSPITARTNMIGYLDDR